jgi:hypothetical protein
MSTCARLPLIGAQASCNISRAPPLGAFERGPDVRAAALAGHGWPKRLRRPLEVIRRVLRLRITLAKKEG